MVPHSWTKDIGAVIVLSSSNIKVVSPENCGISPCALCKVGRNASLAGCLDGCVEWCIAWGLVGLEEMKWNHCNALFYESRAQQSRGGNRCLKMKHSSIELQAASNKQGCRCFSNRCQHCWSPARESKSRLNLLFELMVLPVTEVVVKIHFLFSYWTALVLINLFIPFSLVTVTWHQGEN